jgi:hypothetical protein
MTGEPDWREEGEAHADVADLILTKYVRERGDDAKIDPSVAAAHASLAVYNELRHLANQVTAVFSSPDPPRAHVAPSAEDGQMSEQPEIPAPLPEVIPVNRDFPGPVVDDRIGELSALPDTDRTSDRPNGPEEDSRT